jgi:hypothetical membrane protein
LSSPKIAGTLLFIGALTCVIGITIAETQFPGYSTRLNFISDLASTVSPRTSITEPAATIWNSTVILFGAMILSSSYFIHLGFHKLYLTIILAVLGAALVCVGIFPGDTGTLHVIAALVTFSIGGIAAIVFYKEEKTPLNYISVAIGIWVLLALGIGLSSASMGYESPLRAFFGPGGVERLVTYPILMWAACFGGHLLSDPVNTATLTQKKK